MLLFFCAMVDGKSFDDHDTFLDDKITIGGGGEGGMGEGEDTGQEGSDLL